MVAKAVANSLTESIRGYMGGLESRIRLCINLRRNPGDAALVAQARAVLNADGGASPEPVDDVGRLLESSLSNDGVDLTSLDHKMREIGSVLGQKDGVRSYFLNVKGPELLDKYVGETEHRIRSIFEEARGKATYYTPVVIFFDEMEAMFRTRGSGRSSDVETTIVPQFLSEIDGIEGSANVLLIGATNRDDMIDPAIMRPGRLDVKIKVGRPDRGAAADIFSLYLLPTLPLSPAGLDIRETEGQAGSLVFRAAYARLSEQTAAVHGAMPAGGDLRLALSFNADELKSLGEQRSGVTVGEICAHAFGAGDSDPVWAKVARFKPRTRLDELVARLQTCSQRYKEDAAFAERVRSLVRNEWIAEALIEAAVALLYSPSSTIRVVSRGILGQAGNRYTFGARDFVTGAVIASITSRAKRTALKREVSAPGDHALGISLADMVEAIRNEFNENRDRLASYKLQSELGKAGEEIQAAELHLGGALADPWDEEKPHPFRATAQGEDRLREHTF
jgi:proteasome-associated ATPase